MQPTFAEIKYAAKTSMKHRWTQGIAVSFVFVATALLDILMQYMLMVIFKVTNVWSPFTPTDLPLYSVVASVGTTIFSCLFSLAVMFPLIFGIMRWFWMVTGGSNPDIGEIFHFFSEPKQFFKSFRISIGIYLRLIVGTVVCFLPYIAMSILTQPDVYNKLGFDMPIVMESLNSIVGILEFLGFAALMLWVSSFALFYSVMFSEPELSAHKTIRKTTKMSRGLRFNLVTFVLSFFGWFMLSFLIVPLLFVAPYFLSSMAVYGREAYRASHHRFSHSQAE